MVKDHIIFLSKPLVYVLFSLIEKIKLKKPFNKVFVTICYGVKGLV
jgi:hypothetical protein